LIFNLAKLSKIAKYLTVIFIICGDFHSGFSQDLPIFAQTVTQNLKLPKDHTFSKQVDHFLHCLIKATKDECARIFGIETEVLDIHDGELMPTLENRRKVADLIREWQADIVLCHRPYDYHPDHRYTGVLVEDAAVVVVAPFFSTNSEPTKKNPVFMFYSDGFKKPYPFDPAIVVDIGEAANNKWDCIGAMPSQFADEHSWQASYRADIPKDPEARKAHILELVKKSNMAVADQYRDKLIELYGKEKGKAVKYAEAFELCQYGTQLTTEQLKALFPGF